MVKIKKRLAYWKDFKNKDSLITWAYDSLTFKAVKRFQARHGLSQDGVIGIGTIKALNSTKSERIEQIITNEFKNNDNTIYSYIYFKKYLTVFVDL